MTSELRQAFDPVADALEAEGVEFRISGSVASSTLGVGRSTLDVDLVADLRVEHVPGLVGRLQDACYVDAESIRDAMLAASGQLDLQPADGSLIRHRDILVNLAGNLHEPSTKRSIYLCYLHYYLCLYYLCPCHLYHF